MSVAQTSASTSFADRIQTFLHRYRIAVWSFIGIALVLVIGGVIISQVLQNRATASAEASEDILAQFERWQGSYRGERFALPTESEQPFEASAETRAIEEQLRAQIRETVSRYGRTYGGARAKYTLGLLEWERDSFAAAQAAFEMVAAQNTQSHLAPLALYGAAAAAEQNGDAAAARLLYQRILDWSGPAIDKPRALLSLGRLSEAAGDPSGALLHYERLVDEYPGTSWTNIGRSRIIRLSGNP